MKYNDEVTLSLSETTVPLCTADFSSFSEGSVFKEPLNMCVFLLLIRKTGFHLGGVFPDHFCVWLMFVPHFTSSKSSE